MVCKNCGNELQEGEKFCGKCGNQIDNIENSQQIKKDKTNKINKKIIIVMISIVTVIILGIVIFVVNNAKTNSNQDIYNNINQGINNDLSSNEQIENNKIEKFVKYSYKGEKNQGGFNYNYFLFRNGEYILDCGWDGISTGTNLKGEYIEDNDKIIIKMGTGEDENISEGRVLNNGKTFIWADLIFELDENDKLQKEQEQNSKGLIEATINAYGKITTQYDGKNLTYRGYELYARAKSGENVYKLTYTTGNTGLYYVRLVSLDSTNSRIEKKTDLCKETLSGRQLIVETAYEQVWGK